MLHAQSYVLEGTECSALRKSAQISTKSKSLIFIPISTAVFLSGGSVTVRGTAETAQTNPPPVRLDTADSDSFSATMETALVRTSFATATRTVMTAQTKTPCCVVGCLILMVIEILFDLLRLLSLEILCHISLLLMASLRICFLFSFTRV